MRTNFRVFILTRKFSFTSKVKGVARVGNLGFGEVLIILVVALLIFGPSKLPKLGKAAGETLREFKKGMNGIISEDEEIKKEENK